MKAHEIFKQYIWLTETIHRAGSISLQELLSQGPEVEVLQPEHVRMEMKVLLEKTVERYAEGTFIPDKE